MTTTAVREQLPRKKRRTHFLPQLREGNATSCGVIVRNGHGFPTTTNRDDVNCLNCLTVMNKP